MTRNFRQVWSKAAALAVAVSSALVVTTGTADAVGTLAGPVRVRSAGGAATLTSGTSATPFTLRPPAGAACPGDSANESYLVQTYMVPVSVDPSTLTFDADGPTPQDVGANFRQPLYTTTGSPAVSMLTAPANPAPGPGPIINIPDMHFAVYAPGDIPPGVYNVGIACTQGPPSPTQMKNFYNIRMTFTANPAGGPAQVSWAVATTLATDFDGDGDTDRSVFRNGAWFAHGQATAFLGASGDIPVPANYDGAGASERGVYRNGTWFVDGQATVFHGLASDIPVPADYDGDGDADRAVYRPSSGGWFVDGQATVFFGLSSDIPVPADYDGDGDADRAVFRPSVGGWYVDGQATAFLGLNGDIPVPADYDGDGDNDRAIWRPAVGGWYVDGQATVFLGLNGDVPVPGDYNGNGSADRGIWRPPVGGWYVEGQSPVFLGLTGDIPLPLPQAIYRVFF